MLKLPGKSHAQAVTSTGRGAFYESRARDYLKKQGLGNFLMNFRSRYGEIDIIARDGKVLVFIEVRYRRNPDHGLPVATVAKHKQQKIILTARHFLQKNGLTNKLPCRFDVIGISGTPEALEYRWIKNAFQAGSPL